jgi:monofunctional biosynthetic peptidoglycan transglycosylase
VTQGDVEPVSPHGVAEITTSARDSAGDQAFESSPEKPLAEPAERAASEEAPAPEPEPYPEPIPGTSWNAAIAGALAEPELVTGPTPEPEPQIQPVRPDLAARLESYADAAGARVEFASPQTWATETKLQPEPELVPPAHGKVAPPPAIADKPPRFEPAPTPERIEAPTAFTAAAHELFNPPPTSEVTLETSGYERTIGRRLRDAAEQQAHAASSAPVPDSAIEPRSSPTWKDRARVWLRYAGYAAAGYLALVLFLILVYRFVPPPTSMLMLSRLLTGTWVERTWVPLESISPALVRAVIVSEDDRFCSHNGIDLVAMRQAIEQSGGGVPRGASTISMQVVKNLFLWSSKSYVRKVIEIPLTLIMELVWPKSRIIEVYLNIAEWGPGIFGAEAAARHHFNKPASRLTEREAALLAAALPNPMVRDAGDPNAHTSSKARVVQSRVRAYGAVASCAVLATAVEPAAPAADKPKTVRKTFTRPKTQRKTVDDWSPTLKFGY